MSGGGSAADGSSWLAAAGRSRGSFLRHRGRRPPAGEGAAGEGRLRSTPESGSPEIAAVAAALSALEPEIPETEPCRCGQRGQRRLDRLPGSASSWRSPRNALPLRGPPPNCRGRACALCRSCFRSALSAAAQPRALALSVFWALLNSFSFYAHPFFIPSINGLISLPTFLVVTHCAQPDTAAIFRKCWQPPVSCVLRGNDCSLFKLLS